MRQNCYQDINAPRVQTIIAMKAKRATLDQMGRILNLTRERVRQIILKIAEVHGPNVFSRKHTKEPLWTAREAANSLGKNYELIVKLCHRKKIFSLRNGRNYLITAEGMEQLKDYFFGARTCAVCGEEFTVGHLKGKRKICHKSACRKKRRWQSRTLFFSDKEKAINALCGWRKRLWLALKDNVITDGEKWIKYSEALKVSGLTRMRLTYLRQCRLITIRKDPNSARNLYAFSEMQIAHEIVSQGDLSRRPK